MMWQTLFHQLAINLAKLTFPLFHLYTLPNLFIWHLFPILVVEFVAPTLPPGVTAPPTISPVTQTAVPTDTPTKGESPLPTDPTVTSSPTFEQTTTPDTLPPATDIPSMKPTEVPTLSSPVPTSEPTSTPSKGPTAFPTDFPTMLPTSFEPTTSPSTAPVAVTDTPLFQYLTGGGVPAAALADPETPQGRALRWLLNDSLKQINVFGVAQRYALVAMDYAFHGDSLLSNPFRQQNVDYCEWQGVTCNENLEVTELKWSNQGLTGEMIQEIKILSKLTKVDLAENEITGTLDVFWDLPELTHLYMFSNRLSGRIPADRSAPKNLQKVYLGSNQLTGPLPLTLASSTNGPEALSKLCQQRG